MALKWQQCCVLSARSSILLLYLAINQSQYRDLPPGRSTVTTAPMAQMSKKSGRRIRPTKKRITRLIVTIVISKHLRVDRFSCSFLLSL
ncbi:unnamed protein product [Albugo candida]|uniref:Secreted protein n=1 Tax=Albugo candida TaxID=65357 RepID=A0A024FZG5_9STRA|nr:unnamed protein product [Albugo candida]|eukprot:CCI39979.1 unnamed protein product [Albugo candida]